MNMEIARGTGQTLLILGLFIGLVLLLLFLSMTFSSQAAQPVLPACDTVNAVTSCRF